MSSSVEPLSVTMSDALVGNDYSLCLCSALHAIGVNVELIAPANRVVNFPVDYPVRRWMPGKDSRNGQFRKTLQYLKYLARFLAYAVKRNKEKRIVHFQFFRRERVESLLFPLLRFFGVRVVFTAHNILPHENRRADRLFRSIVYSSAKTIVVHSEYMKKKLIEGFAADPKKVRVVPHGNFDQYVPRERISKAEAKACLNLSATDQVALFFGYIREYKGLDLLLDAFEICAAKGGTFKLVIAGACSTRELENHYRRRVERMSRNDAVLFHPGFVPFEKTPAYFAACDVVVLPYKKIDHSGIVHLAYSFGRPLIATNVGDFSEIIEDGKSGCLLEENTAECLSKTILDAFSNMAGLAEMGNYARRLSESRYSWDGIADQMKKIYVEQM